MNAYVNSRGNVEIVDAEVLADWSHFAGELNERGERVHYIELKLSDDVADFLNGEDFNVRMWVPKDDQKSPVKHLKVRLPWYEPNTNKDWLNSKVNLVSRDKPTVKTRLDHDMWEELDKSIIDHANVTIRLYKGKTRTGTPFKTAQLIIGTFYISGSRSNEYEPDYEKASPASKAQPIEDDDRPF